MCSKMLFFIVLITDCDDSHSWVADLVGTKHRNIHNWFEFWGFFPRKKSK